MFEKVIFTSNEYHNVIYALKKKFGNLHPRTLFKYAIREFVESERLKHMADKNKISAGSKTYKCCICKKNYVNTENGYDTCQECLNKI